MEGVTPAPPVQTAGALLIDPAGRMLLGLRAAHKRAAPLHWDILGGHVEPGETVEAALTRELLEELGVQPVRFHLLDALVERSDDGAPQAVHHVYAVTQWSGGDPRNVSDEHAEIRWFTIGEVHKLTNRTPFDFAGLHARAIRLAAG